MYIRISIRAYTPLRTDHPPIRVVRSRGHEAGGRLLSKETRMLRRTATTRSEKSLSAEIREVRGNATVREYSAYVFWEHAEYILVGVYALREA